MRTVISCGVVVTVGAAQNVSTKSMYLYLFQSEGMPGEQHRKSAVMQML